MAKSRIAPNICDRKLDFSIRRHLIMEILNQIYSSTSKKLLELQVQNNAFGLASKNHLLSVTFES